MKAHLKDPIIRFLLFAFSAYLLWYLIYSAFITDPHTNFDRFFSLAVMESANWLLQLLGFTTVPLVTTNEVTLSLEGSNGFGVWIGTNCNGVSLFALFSIYIFAFPGPWKQKLWFIPTGILLIHLINTVRIAVLTYIARDYVEYLDFNHTYTFQIIAYGFVFYLWYVWTTKFSGQLTPKDEA